ncbi:MAG: arginine--tRNA ligase [Planctomycetes bacterium]|jgi:arginyl-tRNA synthetase|nr:arginine--tRNA ligase [Planctomycetota bacterium]
MYTLDKIKRQLVADINKALGGKSVQASDLVWPAFIKAAAGKPQPDYGDLSLPCFAAAQKSGKRAVDLAGRLVTQLPVGGDIAGIKAVGPYVNFTLSREKLALSVLMEIAAAGDEYGKNEEGKGEKAVIEYSNANTHKEYHIGHLRNLSYGDAVNRVLAANGYQAIPVSYINDFGIHVAKTLWAYLEFYKKAKLPENKGYFLGQVYVRSVREIEKNNLAKELVGFIMKKIESRQGDEYKLWQETRAWSIEEFSRIYAELGIKFKHIFYESEYIEAGKKLVAELCAKGFLKKSEGAVIADLGEHGLGVLLFLRSDGTALYPVADIPLAREKFRKFKSVKSIYVVDVRQALYFKQLFKVLALLGTKGDLMHLGYEFVTLPEGTMSSRTGNVITYRELRDLIVERATAETKDRHPDWPVGKIESTALALAIAAMKFEMVKVSPLQAITFEIQNALRFDGFTAAYLQYTCARINSILKKHDANLRMNANPRIANASKVKANKLNFEKLAEPKEHNIILKLARYPEIVKIAGEKFDPSEVAKYLHDLAGLFNDYYHSVPVLKAEPAVCQARLTLITAVAQVIKNGLDLLGIKTLNEM